MTEENQGSRKSWQLAISPANLMHLFLLYFQRYDKLAKAQLKKMIKLYAQEKKKSEDREKKEVIKLSPF